MKIAYLTSYLGREFLHRYGEGKKFALSGPFKSLGLARAMLSAGHEVTIFSPGVTTCDAIIPAFSEVEEYPEGQLTILYCRIISKRKVGIINDFRISRMLRRMARYFDALVYYNICLSAALTVRAFSDKIRVLEYEDNVFNKALEGDRNSFEFFKRKLYNFLIARTDGVMSVCLGLQLKDRLKYSVLTPGVINDEVINNVSERVNHLQPGEPVHIILAGGVHYSKGGDLLVKSMQYIKTPCVVSVYGNCDLTPAMESLIESVPSYHKFEFNGYMPHAELIKIFDKTADILINTTRSMHVGPQAAGFPFKMMEYASTGRPIVSSEIGRLDDDYNRHITYYEGEDPKAIADAIEDVISNYNQKVDLALELQKKVLKEYTVKGIGVRINDFLTNIQHDKSIVKRE